MNSEAIRIFICYEPDQRLCADRLDSWPRANADLDDYDRRVQTPLESPEAGPIKEAIARQIKTADVTVCIIGPESCMSDWVAWELSVSKSMAGGDGSEPKRNGLVGIVLHEYDRHPPTMVDSGAIFVRFKQDLVERAIRWAVEEPQTSDDFTLQDE